MALQKIGKMSLKNSGGFVARVQFSYLDDDGEKHLTRQSSDILLGQTKSGSGSAQEDGPIEIVAMQKQVQTKSMHES